MKIDDCFYLGYISKAIGTKGELAFKLNVDSPSSYIGLDTVLVQFHENDQQLVPFFIDNSKLQNNDLLRCKLEGVDDQTSAKNLIGKSLYLPEASLPALNDDQFYFHEIIGFLLIDQQKGNLGKVEKVLEYSTSNLFSLTMNEKEVLIPISDEIIVKVNKSKQQILLNCPEGLIDLYLES